MQPTKCELYNASIKFQISFNKNVGTIKNVSTTWLSPTIDRPYYSELDPNPVAMSYLAFFMECSSFFNGLVCRVAAVYRPTYVYPNAFVATPALLGTNLVLSSQIHAMMRRMS